MFGLYLVDSFGNKELIYRDLNCSSLWPMPLRPRAKPTQVAETADASNGKFGHFVVQNVYESDPPLLPDVAINKLRIVQLFPRTSPFELNPLIGSALAACGRQVLGTVPVEKDGSAFFEAPAEVPLAFQVLDDRGRAVQMMRSLTYLQSGETTSCIGCHESRHTAPPTNAGMLALRRAPSKIQRGPNGSKPLSFPLLVQPVLDKHCVSCHNTKAAEGGVTLQGNPVRRRRGRGRFTDSYNALVRMVPFSEWVNDHGFRESNCEPLTQPGFFGALGSPLMKMLDERHGGVELSEEDLERLVTWMDTNALFYGTFESDDMERQLRGEIIEGPTLD
jgi:hypothetical protein